jgi:prepilin-type processing-associated H-X9-DG protein
VRQQPPPDRHRGRRVREQQPGLLPDAGRVQRGPKDDVLFWQKGRNIDDSALAPYLGVPFNSEVWMCPGDEAEVRLRTNGGSNPYPYSYVMNYYFFDRTSSVKRQIKKVNSPSSKWIFFEEDERTIDDCYGSPEQNTNINLLSIRHDRNRRDPDNVSTGISLNGDRRGNALFCDGHAEYIERNEFHKPERYDPAVRK